MFDNIIQLEKEVEEFERNILASKQLVQKIDAVIKKIDAAQKQNADELAGIRSSLQAQIEENARVIHEAESVLQRNNQEMIGAAVSKMGEAMQSLNQHQKNQMEALSQTIERTAADHRQESSSAVQAFRNIAAELAQKTDAAIHTVNDAQKQNAEEFAGVQNALQMQTAENARAIREAESVMQHENQELISTAVSEMKESMQSLSALQKERMEALSRVIENAAENQKQESDSAIRAFRDSTQEFVQKQEDLYQLFRAGQLEQVHMQIQSLEKKLTLLLASVIAVGVLTVISMFL